MRIFGETKDFKEKIFMINYPAGWFFRMEFAGRVQFYENYVLKQMYGAANCCMKNTFIFRRFIAK